MCSIVTLIVIDAVGQYKQRILNAGAEFKKTLECSSS